MREYHKKQCLETLDLFIETHKEIAVLLAKGQQQEAADLLVQCQQGAISLGNFLGGLGDETSAIIKTLEDYCEIIYRIYSDVTAGETSSFPKRDENLENCIISAVKGINALPGRKEVVFLPYKAAMWDSLESVWKAADADENCDAYVIPIPYCDKKPDGCCKDKKE